MKIERRTLLLILLGACAYWGWPGLTQATGEVAVLRPNGTSHIEHYASVWYVRANRTLWIRAENRERHWLDDIRVNPRVELSIDGQNRAYEANPMDMANYQTFIDAEFRTKYGVVDWLRSLHGDRDTLPIRLKPL